MRGRRWTSVVTIVFLVSTMVGIEGATTAGAPVTAMRRPRRRRRDRGRARPARVRPDFVARPLQRPRLLVRRPDVPASRGDEFRELAQLHDEGRRTRLLLEVRQSGGCRRVPGHARHGRELRRRIDEAGGLPVGDDVQHHSGEEGEAPRRAGVLLPGRRGSRTAGRSPVVVWTDEKLGIVGQAFNVDDPEHVHRFFADDSGPLGKPNRVGIPTARTVAAQRSEGKALLALVPKGSTRGCRIVDEFSRVELGSLYRWRLWMVANVESCTPNGGPEGAEYVRFANTEAMDTYYDSFGVPETTVRRAGAPRDHVSGLRHLRRARPSEGWRRAVLLLHLRHRRQGERRPILPPAVVVEADQGRRVRHRPRSHRACNRRLVGGSRRTDRRLSRSVVGPVNQTGPESPCHQSNTALASSLVVLTAAVAAMPSRGGPDHPRGLASVVVAADEAGVVADGVALLPFPFRPRAGIRTRFTLGRRCELVDVVLHDVGVHRGVGEVDGPGLAGDHRVRPEASRGEGAVGGAVL